MTSLKRYLTEVEQEYEDLLTENIVRSTKDTIVNAPMLFQRRTQIQSLLSRYELYKLIRNIGGDIIECGVYQGNSFAFLSNLSVILEPYSVNRRLWGFDTFEGFPKFSSRYDPSDINIGDFGSVDLLALSNCLSAIDRVRPVNRIPRFSLVKGDVSVTVPKFIDDHPELVIALLILDMDLYEPTLLCLEKFIPHMPKGSIIAFDEFNYQRFPGETTALKHFDSLKNFRLERFDHDGSLVYCVL
jgi:hypothetical protein